MSIDDNFEENQEKSTLGKMATVAVCVVTAAALVTLLYLGIKYVCDNYLTEEKLEQTLPKPYSY
jgi:hypothetical protein